MENNLHLIEWEKILLTIKRHWITFVFIGILIFSLITLSFLLFFLKWNLVQVFSEKIFWCFIGIFWIIFSGIIFIIWINMELDFLILTNKRFIYLQQKSFLNREMIEFDIQNIQEVRSNISGILPTLCNYGKISISTATDTSKMHFLYAPNPNENIRKINNYLQELKSEKNL